MGFERLSAQDSVFLHIESPTLPQHVGGLVLLEAGPFFDDQGRFRLDEARQTIGSRLHLVPRFRKKLMSVPFEQGRPVWIDDHDFDLGYHIRLTALPSPGTEEQLKTLMGRLQSHPLDRRRPLWELWFVEGVEGDRVALISKTHHCMVDGVSGLDVATVLFDLAPEPAELEPEPWYPEMAPTPLELLVESVVERVTEPAEMARSARAALRAPQRAVEGAVELLQSFLPLAPAAGRAPEMPWNNEVSPHRRWEEARVSLARVKAIKDAATAAGVTEGKCSVNDVVLAASTGALRNYLIERGHDVGDDLVVKAMVPVSVRDDSQRYALGNRLSMLAAELPVGEPDPRQWLSRVHRMQSQLKASGQAIGADRLIQMSGYVPPTVLGLASRALVRSRLVNLVVTNVPGPQFPLYCMGARVLEVFPYVGLAENLGLMIAVISYDGQMEFGITGDRELLPDLPALAGYLSKAFVELEEAVGTAAPRDAAPPGGQSPGD
ncbi:MAG: WS/DGAT/MGAT family O-acyltransferase [Acidimicrobiales bacterium]